MPTDRDRPADTTRSQFRAATRASLFGQIASQLISILGLAFLLRLLHPEAYGLIGMITPLIMFLRIFVTLGLNVAAVQREAVSDSERSSLFWSQVGLGLATTIVVAVLAPGVAWLYGNPPYAGALTNLTRGLAVTSLLAAIGSQPEALLQRRMDFRGIAWSRCAAQLLAAAVAIAAALAGAGVWALVVQQIVELAALAGLLFASSGWRPGPPGSAAELARMLRFGGAFAVATAMLYVGDHLDKYLVGRLIGPTAVGLYGQAFNLMIKPVYLVTTPLTALALAAVARTRAPAERTEVVVGFYRMLAIALLPTSVGVALIGDELMLLLGGPAWSEAGPLLTALAVGLFAQAMVILNGWIMAACGRIDRLLIGATACLVMLLQGYLFGWWLGNQYGAATLGVAWGRTLTVSAALLLPHTWLALSTAGVPLRKLVLALFTPARATAVMAVAVAALNLGLLTLLPSPAIRLPITIGAGVLIYAGFCRDDLRWLARQFRFA